MSWCEQTGGGLGSLSVGSLRSAICLLAAGVDTLGGQGGGPPRGTRGQCGVFQLRSRGVNTRTISACVFGLYRPHGPAGASRFGPTGWVTCDVLMRKQLLRWQTLLFDPCGVSVKRSLLRSELEAPPKIFIDVTSDACLADVARAGIGGFCPGLYWFYEIPRHRPSVPRY